MAKINTNLHHPDDPQIPRATEQTDRNKFFAGQTLMHHAYSILIQLGVVLHQLICIHAFGPLHISSDFHAYDLTHPFAFPHPFRTNYYGEALPEPVAMSGCLQVFFPNVRFETLKGEKWTPIIATSTPNCASNTTYPTTHSNTPAMTFGGSEQRRWA